MRKEPKEINDEMLPLEVAAEEYLQNVKARFLRTLEYPTAKEAFIAGAEWQKEQMMKEEVEGEIGYWNQRGLSIMLDQSLEKLGYDENTRVKIIIVKEDERKKPMPEL